MDDGERNRRRSERLKARWADPEARAKLERNGINEDCPGWLRTQRSERMRRRWADKADRDRLSAAMRRPETSQKRSERMVAHWADPVRRSEHSKKVAAAIPAKTPEERRANAAKAWRTKKAKADSLLQDLLNSPTPEIEPPRNPVTLSTRRFGETHSPALASDIDAMPVGTDGDDER